MIFFTRRGWPTTVPPDLKPFSDRRHELTVEGNCLLWGARVDVPTKLQQRILADLHRDHGGVVRMKAVARSYMWWPGMDSDLKKLAKSCAACQSVKSAPIAAALHPWLWPDQHIDYTGPFRGKMFLLLIDAHSKWLEIFEMASSTSESTIAMLIRVFAAYRLPKHLVSDNGPQFTSTEFHEFLQANGVKHIQMAPYHPASNGAVERLVQTFKQAMKAGEQDGFTLQHQLQNFLITYRSTPHTTTGQCPGFLVAGKTPAYLLQPMVGERVHGEQAHQKHHHDAHGR